jgi:glucose-1-phosphate cytidylyltransferase
VFDIGSNDEVNDFVEKPKRDGSWINGGFFVLKPDVLKYLPDNADNIMWEQEPMKMLVKDDQLSAFKHYGFWKSMDILRDKVELEKMWQEDPRWKIWT